MTFRTAFAVITGLAMAGAASAAAGPATGLSDKSVTTGFSGAGRGPSRDLTMPAAAGGAIVGVVVDEESDDPCFVELRYRDVQSGAAEPSRTMAECEGRDGRPSKGLVADPHALGLGQGSFVTGARVCLNGDRDKVKGLQIFGQYDTCLLGATAITFSPSECTMVRQGGIEQRLCSDPRPVTHSCTAGIANPAPWFELPNCAGDKRGPDADWEAAVKCPTGMVATGMTLSTRESDRDRQMIDGLALECRPLQGSSS